MLSAKVLTYGSDSSGTVKVFMNGQEKGSASANTVSQKLELVFNTGAQGFADCGNGRFLRHFRQETFCRCKRPDPSS